MKKRVSFDELDFMYPKHFFQISNFKIPISIHIKDLKFSYTKEIEISGVGEDFEFEKLKLLNIFKQNLIFINTKDNLYDGFTKNFLEYYNLNNLEDLLLYLDEFDFNLFIEHIKPIINFMIATFRNRLYNMLKLDEKEPNIPYTDKHKKPKELEEFLKYTEGYIIAQSIIEYSPQPFFDENIGKGVNEYSWRELEFRLAYLTMKNKIESIENKWQMKIMQDDSGKT